MAQHLTRRSLLAAGLAAAWTSAARSPVLAETAVRAPSVTGRVALRTLAARLGPSHALAADGATPDHAALNAVLAHAAANGIKVSGEGLTYRTAADVIMPAGLDIESLTLTRQDLPPGGRILRSAHGADRIRARGITIRATGDRGAGDVRKTYGFMIDGGTGHVVEDVDVSMPGKVSLIALVGCTDSTFTGLHAHDCLYDDPRVLDDTVQGILLLKTRDCRLVRPRVENLGGNGALRPAMALPGGVAAGAPSNLWTRGIALSGNSGTALVEPTVRFVDQAIDISGSMGNVGISVERPSISDVESHGVKLANTAYRCTVTDGLVVRAGRVAYVASGPTSAPDNPETQFTSQCEFVRCTARDTGGKRDAAGRAIKSYYAQGKSTICGFRIEESSHDKSYPRGIRVVDCVAEDTQAVPTMTFGYLDDIAAAMTAGHPNECRGFRSSGHTLQAQRERRA